MLVIRRLVRQRPDAVLQVEPGEPEPADDLDDLGGHGLGRADEVGAVRPRSGLVLLERERRPAALAADLGVHRLVVRPGLVDGLPIGAGDVAVRVHADRRCLRVAELLERAVVEIDVGREAHAARRR